MKRIHYIVIFILLVATGFFLAYEFVYNKKHPDFKELEANYKLSAEQLYTEFTSDNEASSLKYNGKMIVVSGTPTRIDIEDTLTIAVFVFNEGMFGDEGVRCTFLTSVGHDIQEGASLKGFDIKGYCSGYNDVDVVLEKCSFEKSN
ncbi:MAG TPA: hypothetical protein DCX54_00740 [Flavobacteriales bacterium]|nr:hypothetical protein [Flavobacteriales bacterium]